MKKLCITFGIGLLLCASLYAAGTDDVVVREVIGRGSTRSQAIKDALYVAVGQSRGVEVDSGRYEMGFSESGIGVETDKSETGKSRRIQFDSVSVDTSGTVYTTKIGGSVKTYEVLEEKEVADGYEVKLRVTVVDYGPRGEAHRPKVGLMFARTLEPTYSFFGDQVSGEVVSAMFTQRLAVALTQTNKFAVLDRESIAEFAREKSLLVSNEAPLEERAKLAEMLGSDYLLVGTISQAMLQKQQVRLEAANYTVNKYKARVVFNYRLILSYSRQIVCAGVVEKYLENEEIRALADEQSSAEWDPTQVRDAVFGIVANEVVEKIIDQLYPVRVAAVQADGQVVLNQGGDRISPGALLEVYTSGQEIIDPDTKESLGKVEALIATIRVTKVANKMSFAEVVSGDKSKIAEGLVCRPKQMMKKRLNNVGAEPEVIRTPGGGVKLPFDR